MAIEDLDLEFEDEEEEEKSDALEVDVDLSFSASNDSSNQPQSNKKAVGKSTTLSANANDAADSNIKTPKNNKPIAAQPAAAPKPQAKPTQMPKANNAASNNVARIADHPQRSASTPAATTPQPQAKVTSQQVQSPVQAPAGLEDYQYELDVLREQISELKEQMRNVRQHADVKVAVAEAKSEFIIEYMTNAKLLDHQVNQLLQRIHKKVPALKTEVLTIKKYMTEFLEKSGKKKN